MARQQPKRDRDGSTVVRDVIRRARDSTPADSARPVKVPVDLGERGSTHVLPNGTRLAEFEILGLIGEGGFGIVYLAHDHSLGRKVAIKEYMPSGMASRTHTLHVSVRSKDQAAVFKAGLRSFINEARLLAQFDSPSLVKVFRFWEGNNTAYMVMPFYEGITLKTAYKERKIIPTEEWIKIFLVNLCDALEMIHRARCYHRDIAPDNILVLPEGRPLLLDFGAARQVINERTQGPTAILKPGFAPIEQYANIADLKQGPWTDVYALAGVVYYLMTGKAPLPAVARYVKDEMPSAREVGRKRYSAGFLAAIDRALAVRPEQRFQSIAELRSALGIDGEVPHAMQPATPPDIPELTQRAEPTQRTEQTQRAERTQRADRTTRSPAAPDATQTLAATHLLTASPTPPARPADDAKTQRIEPRLGPLEPPAPAQPASAMRPDPLQAPPQGRLSPAHLKLGAAALALLVVIAGAMTYRTMSNPPGDAGGQSDSTAASTPGTEVRPVPAPDDSAPTLAQNPTLNRDPGATRTPADPGPATGSTGTPGASLVPGHLSALNPVDGAAATPAPPSDAVLWKEATTLRTAAAYQRYLENYPKGRHARQANERLAKLQPDRAPESEAPLTASAPPQAPDTKQPASTTANGSSRSGSADPTATAAEGAAWSRAILADTAPAYRDYLRAYPDGPNARTARNRLEILNQKQALAAGPTSDPAASQSTAQAATQSAPQPAAQAAAQSATQAAAQATTQAAAQATVRPPAAPPGVTPSTADKSPTEAAQGAGTRSPAAPTPPVVVQNPPPALSTKPTPAPPTVRDADSRPPQTGNTIRVAGQTFAGNFTVDPASGIVSGSGRVTWSNGDRFDGTMVNGVKQGQGEFVWANGQRYKGTWARDLPNGSGTLHFANGNDYVGQVRDGVPNGRGSLKYADGGKYQGNFSNGLPDGIGMTAYKNGDAYDGHWAKGKSNGHGKYTWANGDAWEGEFRNDQRTADGKMVFAGSSASTAAPETASESATRDADQAK